MAVRRGSNDGSSLCAALRCRGAGRMRRRSSSLSCAGAPLGYHYHDGTHIGGCAPASPQAIYNASHGTWLWPPQEMDTPPIARTARCRGKRRHRPPGASRGPRQRHQMRQEHLRASAPRIALGVHPARRPIRGQRLQRRHPQIRIHRADSAMRIGQHIDRPGRPETPRPASRRQAPPAAPGRTCRSGSGTRTHPPPHRRAPAPRRSADR